MTKTIGYYLFALIYNLCRLLPIKRKRVFCIKTHDDGEGSNVSIVERALRGLEEGYTFSYLTQSDTTAVKSLSGIKVLLSFFFFKPFELARAEIILMDNVFLPYAYIHRRKGSKVIQLWHGTGTIKKFGQDCNTGKLKELEKRANANITHLIVNSPAMKELYAAAFGVSKELVYPIGLPKTDELLQCIQRIAATGANPEKEYIYRKYKIPKNKKLILYAPTFRDEMEQNPRLIELIKELSEALSEEYFFGLRLHPFIAHSYAREQLGENLCQLSFEKDATAVLLAADMLITDYSSIIFEYCLLRRPMLFFAYDFDEFSDRGRGFYYNYDEYVPGPVAYSSRELIEILRKKDFDLTKIEKFLSDNYLYMDGNATKRLLELIEQRTH
jgi:CDP-ribitol ribitolphosphotransferase